MVVSTETSPISDPSTANIPENANDHCPGPSSENAGQADSCAGCPNQTICASNAQQAQEPDSALEIIKERMSFIKRKILVLSGKGGVGKSTVSTHLAYTFSVADESSQIGLMDLDICGPSLPTMTGMEGERIHQSNSGWSPVYINENLSLMSIGFMLPHPDEAVIWRGPKKNGLIKQFLKDVDWGELDYLIVDTPPGTSDEHLSLVQYLKESQVDGAVIVSTPNEVSLQDVRKEIQFCRKVGLRIIGLVENMSGFVCPSCHGESLIFPPDSGGTIALADELNLPFLGSIPLDPRIGQACDAGQNFFDTDEGQSSRVYNSYQTIVERIQESFENKI